MICRHCRICRASRPRGLCWACFYTPGVRDLYQPVSKFGRRGLQSQGRSPPTSATEAAPGSPEKILVLMQRAELGQGLWHPEDADLAGPATRRRISCAG
jgi:hypothetical protein